MPDQNIARPSYKAYQILRFGFIVLPIVTGIDKFFNLFVNWSIYLSPLISNLINAHIFMKIVGVVEVIVGLLVIYNPRTAAYIITIWLWLIIVNLLTIPSYFDIALRDFGLSLGALALAKLAQEYFISKK